MDARPRNAVRNCCTETNTTRRCGYSKLAQRRNTKTSALQVAMRMGYYGTIQIGYCRGRHLYTRVFTDVKYCTHSVLLQPCARSLGHGAVLSTRLPKRSKIKITLPPSVPLSPIPFTYPVTRCSPRRGSPVRQCRRGKKEPRTHTNIHVYTNTHTHYPACASYLVSS